MRVWLRASCSLGVLATAGTLAAQSSSEAYTYDALGRLIVAETTGGQNNNENHSICYDPSGNRTLYQASSEGIAAGCVNIGSSTSTPTPTPSPTPTPTNNPPATTNDLVSGPCYYTVTVNLTANDTDPEGHYPLALTAISVGTGYGGAHIVSASSVGVDFGPAGDISVFTYTVRDSLGATSTGKLTVSTSSCGGGLEP